MPAFGDFSKKTVSSPLFATLTAVALFVVAFLTGCGGGSSTTNPPPPAAPTVTITANPTSIATKQSSTLTVTATNATGVVVSNNVDSSTITLAATGGTAAVTPTATTTYTATATGTGGTKTATATVTFVLSPTVTISASPTSIFASQSSTLTVTATNATSVVISNNVDSTTIPLGATGGTTTVSPTATTIYTATATGAAPTLPATAPVTVTVTPAPTVTLTPSTPSVISGQAVTLTATATNASQVVITDNIDSTKYTLPGAGGTQVVNPTADITYTATASDSGGFTSTATTSITTVTASTPVTFDGIASSDVASPGYSIDANGAIGTRQYLEWINVYYQAFDKQSFQTIYNNPQPGTTPWASLPNCSKNIQGDGVVLFDRLATRWVMAAHTSQQNNYYYCVAVSNTDDLNDPTFAWYAYEFSLNAALGTNSHGNVYFPDWPKLGNWPDAYYMSADLNDVDNQFQEVGILACALDRADMLQGVAAKAPICFSIPHPVTGSLYLAHSMVPADFEGYAPPPTGRHEYYVSIQNPANDGVSTTSSTINLWDFHVDWTGSTSSFTQSSLPVNTYTPGCYLASAPTQSDCVPEPSTATTNVFVDSVGDRLEPRLAYRNFGTYESFLVSHTIDTGNSTQTGIRWYELRGSSTPTIFQQGLVSPDTTTFRFLPSIAQDNVGNMAVGYSVSSSTVHPGISASYWIPQNPTSPAEISLFAGAGDQENSPKWGSYSSMTVDPSDDCTFWYVNEYFPVDQTGGNINWHTRISNFKVSTCQ
jgi:hypothetical protein